MPTSCKCILDRMVFKGAMTKDERDKIVRNLKTQNEGIKTVGKLIDVDAFKARLSVGLVYQGADVLEALDEQPTIEERKTGKWVLAHPLQEDDDSAYVCSCCKSGSYEVIPKTWKACPWCTALMEVEE